MTRKAPPRRPLLLGSLTLIAGLALHSIAEAAKPGGGGGGSQPGGTIYFRAASASGSMKADGSGKTPLLLPGDIYSAPSRLLHGNQCWFVQCRYVSGDVYPNGQGRRELFLLREDGDDRFTIQLTDDPALEFTSDSKWTPGDQFISGVARRWNADGTVDPESVGVYVSTVAFDSQGNGTGLESAPIQLGSFGVVRDRYGDWTSDDWGYDWSPDLTQIVYADSGTDSLRVLDLSSGEDRLLIDEGSSPIWSPDGSRIAYYNFTTTDAVVTISPNGSGRKVVARGGSDFGVAPAEWSPSGAHLLYHRWSRDFANYEGSDVYRMTATGGDKTNLTGDIGADAGTLGWRPW